MLIGTNNQRNPDPNTEISLYPILGWKTLENSVMSTGGGEWII